MPVDKDQTLKMGGRPEENSANTEWLFHKEESETQRSKWFAQSYTDKQLESHWHWTWA